LGGACKFYPSCSHYGYEAISIHGARRGALLALRRIGRCHPFGKGGFDPVPAREAGDDCEFPDPSGGPAAAAGAEERAR